MFFLLISHLIKCCINCFVLAVNFEFFFCFFGIYGTSFLNPAPSWPSLSSSYIVGLTSFDIVVVCASPSVTTRAAGTDPVPLCVKADVTVGSYRKNEKKRKKKRRKNTQKFCSKKHRQKGKITGTHIISIH